MNVASDVAKILPPVPMREDNDMTQAALAKLLGMSQTGYSKYETGENDVPTQILIKLADLYGTSVDYLLGRTDKR